MQLPPTGIGRTFTAELHRTATIEEKTMDELCAQIAELCGLKPNQHRQLYNWRSGKWPLPSNVIPILCRRFRSLALLHALEDECNDVAIDVPDGYDLTREVSRTVRRDLQAYERYLNAFESDGIEPHELQELRELMEDVVRNAHRFLEIAATDCDRRSQARVDPRSIQGSSTDHSKDHAHVSTDRGQRR